jgi:hypothetical protein
LDELWQLRVPLFEQDFSWARAPVVTVARASIRENDIVNVVLDSIERMEDKTMRDEETPRHYVE